jgi:hypothetical protein
MPLRGACLCGAVRYEVDGDALYTSHCHCTMCQKAHGAAFASYATVRASQHRLTSGAELIRRYASSPTVVRSFCGQCGSPLLWVDRERFPDDVSFPLGSLDTPIAIEQHRHIYLDTRASWCP